PFGIAIADFDADGKPDIAVSNKSDATIYVYKNMCSGSAIAFAGGVSFAAGSAPAEIYAGDLDGDGKPDIAVANSGSSGTAGMSVLRNTATPGSITAGSFAAKIDFTTGNKPGGITAADIDGDGKPELITANQYSHTISVFRNTSTSGTITAGSFAA